MQARNFVSESSKAQRTAAVVGEPGRTRECIRCFAEQELALRRERQERAEAKDADELGLRRRLGQDRRAVREQVTREASRNFNVNRGEAGKKSQGSEPVQANVAKSECVPQPLQGRTLGPKPGSASTFEDHPYRLYFNWPALREDHVTGKAG